MRYLSWLEGWLGRLFLRPSPDGSLADAVGMPRSAEPSSEDLFYIAMLGPHV